MLLVKNRLICSLVVDAPVELFHVLHAAAIQMSTIQGRVFPPVIETVPWSLGILAQHRS